MNKFSMASIATLIVIGSLWNEFSPYVLIFVTTLYISLGVSSLIAEDVTIFNGFTDCISGFFAAVLIAQQGLFIPLIAGAAVYLIWAIQAGYRIDYKTMTLVSLNVIFFGFFALGVMLGVKP